MVTPGCVETLPNCTRHGSQAGGQTGGDRHIDLRQTGNYCPGTCRNNCGVTVLPPTVTMVGMAQVALVGVRLTVYSRGIGLDRCR